MNEMHPLEDLFAIPLGGDKYIVYAPLRGIIFEANQVAVGMITATVAGQALLGEHADSIKAFVDAKGLLDPPETVPPCKIGPFGTHLTLSLTERCNLRCVYCYAGIGTTSATIAWETAVAAVNTTVKNAAGANLERYKLTFHGTGEAFMAWDLMQRTVVYADRRAVEYGLQPEFSVVTNGTLITPKRAGFMAEHGFSISLSMDGLRQVQDMQRPFVNGKGSFDAVMRGVRAIRQASLRTSVRSTVTVYNVHQLVDMVDFFSTEVLPPEGMIHLEPMEFCGRGADCSYTRLTPAVFVDEYKKAALRAEELGHRLRCSVDRNQDLTRSFCGANGRIFCVLPRGEVSGCTRITWVGDELADAFFYAQFQPEGNLDIDESKVAYLHTLGLDTAPASCQSCFCKWQCAGFCHSARLASEDGHRDFMCEVAREVNKWKLLRKLKTSGKRWVS